MKEEEEQQLVQRNGICNWKYRLTIVIIWWFGRMGSSVHTIGGWAGTTRSTSVSNQFRIPFIQNHYITLSIRNFDSFLLHSGWIKINGYSEEKFQIFCDSLSIQELDPFFQNDWETGALLQKPLLHPFSTFNAINNQNNFSRFIF